MHKFRITIEANINDAKLEAAKQVFRGDPKYDALDEETQDLLNISGFLGALIENLGERSDKNELRFIVDDEITVGKKTDEDFFAVITTERVE